ncbi:PAAR domain-containing protein [Candidatus Eisenbacteria bacterium]|uniref:PAAR domain-containing protein n=1 Tax=Eiseniibacteriota bacterium TaxID=2212470 RepID=A0ABV6YKA4_UNCEI
MSKSAARKGDVTVHGGSIVGGQPNVLIGGAPAARLGDMHLCPMNNPGPSPHVGGPITVGSATVMIGGASAARVGDMCQCCGPPDCVAMGCETVLIGDGGGTSGGREVQSTASKSAEDAWLGSTGGRGDAEETEQHFLHVEFVDKGGFPISGIGYTLKSPDGTETSGALGGKIVREGIPPGDYEVQLRAITCAHWSMNEVRVGETVTLSADTAGIESGAEASLQIFIKDIGVPDRLLRTLEAQVSNDKIEADWVFEVDEEYLRVCEDRERRAGYSSPAFYFVAAAGGCTARSAMLRYKDWIEIKLVDEEGNAVGNQKYRLNLPNGDIREGTLDSNGFARVEDVPPGKVRVTFDLSD